MGCKHSHKISDDMQARILNSFKGKCWLCGASATIVCPGSGDGSKAGDCAAYCDGCHHLVHPAHRQVVQMIHIGGQGDTRTEAA
jgi:hypothetical protein